MCVVVYTSIVKLEVTRLVVGWRGCGCFSLSWKSEIPGIVMKKVESEKSVEDTMHVLCVGVFIRPRICQANLVLRVGGEVLQHI